MNRALGDESNYELRNCCNFVSNDYPISNWVAILDNACFH